ncbi:sensor domain-containing protein [Iamia majanohamensis]|uniref:Sensor domain-containing protein n=1 Tax=Iamia majanohamensis TaxID=467976 RepID=A0AAE9Y7S8_9ACTN|nr:sensor domain-containing protein [Iamia majanohamensis]WCO68344.1 sensor domain-containing protein [Iamia majanohamensis]
MHRPRIAACAVAAALVLALAACGGDDDSGTTTTSTSTLPDAPSTAGTDDGATTTAGDDDGGPTTTAAPTTSPNLPPSDSPLVDQLLDPAAVGEGFAPDDTLGDGTFDGDLCEDVTIEPSWDDQAGQGLSRAEEGGDLTAFTQAVLDFPDDAAAEAFVAEVREGQTTCLGGEATDVDAGDEAFLISVSDEEGSAAAAVVRIGPRVTSLTALGPTDPGPLDEELVQAAAAAIGG